MDSTLASCTFPLRARGRYAQINDTAVRAQMDSEAMTATGHFVQFYESDRVLTDSVSGFAGAGLKAGETCILVATPVHRDSIELELCSRGYDLLSLRSNGQYICLDAEETLAQFMVDGMPDPARFREVIGSLFSKADGTGRAVRAFGEMVALLWSEGQHDAAIRLEELWNDLGHRYQFSLLCGYRMDGFGCRDHAAKFADICTRHTHVVPAESYSINASPEANHREIALLQQQAQSLRAEVERAKAAEEALGRRERELSDLLENALEGIHQVGPDGIILWANRAELELLGLKRDEYIGHHVSEFHVDADTIAGMLRKLLGGEDLVNCPARLRRKDGAILDVLVHSNACFENGEFVHSRCFTRDITENRKNDLVHQRLAAIVDSSDDAIIGKTLQGVITSWNKGAERIFGYTAEEAIGKHKTFVFPPDRYHEEVDILARVASGRRVDHFETVRVRKDGTLMDVSLTISPINDYLGTIVGASTIARDITEAKRQQEQLERLNARLQRAMQETHHRVKNNLQVITAMIEMQTFEHSAEKTVPVEEYSRLKSQVCTIAVIHDLLTKGLKETEEEQLISIKAVLDKLIPMLELSAWKRAVTFHVTDADIPSKQCLSLALVINELVSNAQKHGKSCADVRFTVDGDQAQLEVCDDGPGFPEGFDPVGCANTGLELIASLVNTDLGGQAVYDNSPSGGGMVRVIFALPRPGRK